MTATGDQLPATLRSQLGVWRFGAVVLDERIATISVGAKAVDVDRSSYDILLALLRHAGEVVTKDELLEAGWPGRVVSENSLAKAVSRLRTLLGTDGAALRVVHGYGYRLSVAASYRATPLQASEAHPHEATCLQEGDPLPHRPGWRLIKRLGEGSAGVIFLTQSEEGPSRAVKLATSEAGLRSLKREIALHRYIQATRTELLNVAPVLDWNLSQPPFFLELPYYESGNLREWADRRGGLATIPLNERLALCALLCDAVADLHEIGIIHKDLKPENLYPVPDTSLANGWRILLADLGAGEAMHPPRLAELGITMSLARPSNGTSSPQAGSLLYIAPEVIAGEMSTQRGDVYALGVLICQLVTGDLRRSLAPGWELDIDDPLLREDIALAAAANPEKRPIDARGLALRLRSLGARNRAQHVEQEQQALTRRQAEQLVRVRARRTTWLTLSLGLAIGLVAAVSMFLRAQSAEAQARHAATEARREARNALAVLSFFTLDVLGAANPFGDGATALTVVDAVNNAADRIDQRLKDDPVAAAAVHGAVGNVYQGLARYPDAARHLQRQRELLLQMHGLDSLAVARVDADLCRARYESGDYDAAERHCQEAGRIERAQSGALSTETAVTMAEVRFQKGAYRETLALVAPELVKLQNGGDIDLLARAVWISAIAHNELKEFPQADRDFRELIRLREKQFGDKHPQTAWAYAGYGEYLSNTGRQDAARVLITRAMHILDERLGREHPDTTSPRFRLAGTYLAERRWREASDLLEPVVTLRNEKLGSAHLWTMLAAHNLLWALAEQGHAAKADRLFADLQPLVENEYANAPSLQVKFYRSQILALAALERLPQARALLVRLRRINLGTSIASTSEVSGNACAEADLEIAILRKSGDLRSADAWLQRCPKGA